MKHPKVFAEFGIATREITPPVGIYHRMWGAAKHDKSEGVHRPLLATALVFQNGGDDEIRQIVLALDHCLLYQPEVRQLLERINQVARPESSTGVLPQTRPSKTQGVPPSPPEPVITFSHTHAAGLMDPRRADMPGGDLIEPYLQQLYKLAGEAVAEALATVRPAVIRYASGHCALAANRDFWDENNEMFVCGFNPQVTADDTVLVAHVTDANSDEPTATIINYACHPTTLAWDNRLISPDFVGAMRETVERNTGAPCVFLQGASGDLGPRRGFVGDTLVADRNGRQLSFAALSALESLLPPKQKMRYAGPVISGATIGAWHVEEMTESELQTKKIVRVKRWTVPLKYRAELPTAEEAKQQLEHWSAEEQTARAAGDDAKAADARAMAERMRRLSSRLRDLPPGEQFPFPVTMWRLGDALWIAVEGEPYNLLQSALRERFPDRPIFVVVLSGGSRASYLPDKETYDKGVYQESIAILEKGCLEELIDALSAAIAGVFETE